MKSFELFGAGRLCDLSRYAQNSRDVISNEMDELEKQNCRAAGIYRRLYEEGAPGVLLADEVGKGKTYVALGVAFALLAHNSSARVVVLTHSRTMAKEWASRWSREMKANCPDFETQFDENGDWQPTEFKTFDELERAYQRKTAPSIAFGSYETLKKFGTLLEEVSFLHSLLTWVFDFGRIRLSELQRRHLIRTIVGKFDFRRTLRPVRISSNDAHHFLEECFEIETKTWKVSPNAVRDRVNEFIANVHGERLEKQIDLLIVDEAHKLDGTLRQHVIRRLLNRRFDRCLFVTATPFALSVEQFRARLIEFGHARTCQPAFVEEIKRLPLEQFARAVARGEDFPEKNALESVLRKYVVRDTWNHTSERQSEEWKAVAQDDAVVPTLILERIIDTCGRTHIASRRESLCSSWAAAIKSLEQSPFEQATSWSRLLRQTVSGASGSARADPKMLAAIAKLTKLALRGEKVVVFTQRAATARLLQKLLLTKLREQSADFRRRSTYWRRHAQHIATFLELDIRHARVIGKMMAHSLDAPDHLDRNAIRRWWNKHSSRAFSAQGKDLSSLEQVLGRGRRLQIVARYDSDSGEDDSYLIQKFNLPSAPLILIATPKGQEGIDLHRYCRRVVLYDLTWNPAHMEQRIGRVHRLGGAHSSSKKVVVTYCYQEGTYEALMAKRVQERCKMLRVLLGAGQWLDRDEEIANVERYQMSFPP